MPRCEKMRCAVLALLISVFGIPATQRAAGDWPTYRGDSRRSGVSSEPVGLPLAQQWVHKPAHPPQPAWPEMPARLDVYRGVQLGPTVVFDRAFHSVVEGDSLYYGSSADDTAYCLDASTGRTRWSFTTEGPVRLAPTLVEGRVYVGSDDGCVYCLAAADGQLVWKHRVGPADRRLPGNGRMISLWPVRCGLVVDGGTVYVGAGLFPSQGTYLCALDAFRLPLLSAVLPGGRNACPDRSKWVETCRSSPCIVTHCRGRRPVAPIARMWASAGSGSVGQASATAAKPRLRT